VADISCDVNVSYLYLSITSYLCPWGQFVYIWRMCIIFCAIGFIRDLLRWWQRLPASMSPCLCTTLRLEELRTRKFYLCSMVFDFTIKTNIKTRYWLQLF
jgi:hypothetical protein